MQIKLQDFAVARSDGQLGISAPGQDLQSTGTRKTTWYGKLWNAITRSSGDKQAFRNAKTEFMNLVRREYGDAIGNVIQQHVDARGGGSPLTGVRAQTLLRAAEEMRTELSEQSVDILKSGEMRGFIHSSLKSSVDKALRVDDFPLELQQLDLENMSKEVMFRVLERPEFKEAGKLENPTRAIGTLIRQEAEKLGKERAEAAHQLHFALKHHKPPITSSDLTPQETSTLLNALIKGTRSKLKAPEFSVSKLVHAYSELKDIMAKDGITEGPERSKMLNSMFDLQMVRRQPLYLSEGKFRAALEKDYNNAKAIRDEMELDGIYPDTDPKFAELLCAMVDLAGKLPGVPPMRLLAFATAVDVAARSGDNSLRIKVPFYRPEIGARSMRPDLFQQYERALGSEKREQDLANFTKSVKAFVHLDRVSQEGEFSAKTPFPSDFNVRTTDVLREQLGTEETQLLRETLKEGASLRDRDYTIPGQARAFYEVGRAGVLIERLEKALSRQPEVRLKDRGAREMLNTLKQELIKMQDMANTFLRLGVLGDSTPGLDHAPRHVKEFAKMVQGHSTRGDFARMAGKFQQDLDGLAKYKALGEGAPPSVEAEQSVRQMLFSAQVLSSGSTEAAAFLRNIIADPETNKDQYLAFQQGLGTVLDGRDWNTLTQTERDEVINETVAGMVGGPQLGGGEKSTTWERGVEIAGKARLEMEGALEEFGQPLDSFVEAGVQTMSDDPEMQKWLTENLDDPKYSKENFVGFEDVPDSNGARFRAVFKEGSIEFSNRSSTIELRGARLKDLLKNTEYTSLRNLIEPQYRTENDSMLLYLTPTTRALLERAFDQDRTGMEEAVRLLKDERIPGTNTTYGALFKLERSLKTLQDGPSEEI